MKSPSAEGVISISDQIIIYYGVVGRLVILGILLTLLRATKSRDIFSSLYGYRALVNTK